MTEQQKAGTMEQTVMARIESRRYETEQRRRAAEERGERRIKEGWKRELRIGERQFNTIEPKMDRIVSLWFERRIGAMSNFDRNKQSFHWHKYTEGLLFMKAKAPHELTEAERLVDDFVDLLRGENATDQEIRKKIDQLQQVRERAREELPRAERELAAVLTTPRQEAVFLIMGYIH